VVLASLSSTGYWVVIASWLGLCLLIFLFSPRDIQGRRRATGCLFFLIVFFGAIFLAFAAWAADSIF
jgi:bacteriorhodopsin